MFTDSQLEELTKTPFPSLQESPVNNHRSNPCNHNHNKNNNTSKTGTPPSLMKVSSNPNPRPVSGGRYASDTYGYLSAVELLMNEANVDDNNKNDDDNKKNTDHTTTAQVTNLESSEFDLQNYTNNNFSLHHPHQQHNSNNNKSLGGTSLLDLPSPPPRLETDDKIRNNNNNNKFENKENTQNNNNKMNVVRYGDVAKNLLSYASSGLEEEEKNLKTKPISKEDENNFRPDSEKIKPKTNLFRIDRSIFSSGKDTNTNNNNQQNNPTMKENSASEPLEGVQHKKKDNKNEQQQQQGQEKEEIPMLAMKKSVSPASVSPPSAPPPPSSLPMRAPSQAESYTCTRPHKDENTNNNNVNRKETNTNTEEKRSASVAMSVVDQYLSRSNSPAVPIALGLSTAANQNPKNININNNNNLLPTIPTLNTRNSIQDVQLTAGASPSSSSSSSSSSSPMMRKLDYLEKSLEDNHVVKHNDKPSNHYNTSENHYMHVEDYLNNIDISALSTILEESTLHDAVQEEHEELNEQERNNWDEMFKGKGNEKLENMNNNEANDALWSAVYASNSNTEVHPSNNASKGGGYNNSKDNNHSSTTNHTAIQHLLRNQSKLEKEKVQLLLTIEHQNSQLTMAQQQRQQYKYVLERLVAKYNEEKQRRKAIQAEGQQLQESAEAIQKELMERFQQQKRSHAEELKRVKEDGARNAREVEIYYKTELHKLETTLQEKNDLERNRVQAELEKEKEKNNKLKKLFDERLRLVEEKCTAATQHETELLRKLEEKDSDVARRLEAAEKKAQSNFQLYAIYAEAFKMLSNWCLRPEHVYPNSNNSNNSVSTIEDGDEGSEEEDNNNNNKHRDNVFPQLKRAKLEELFLSNASNYQSAGDSNNSKMPAVSWSNASSIKFSQVNQKLEETVKFMKEQKNRTNMATQEQISHFVKDKIEKEWLQTFFTSVSNGITHMEQKLTRTEAKCVHLSTRQSVYVDQQQTELREVREELNLAREALEAARTLEKFQASKLEGLQGQVQYYKQQHTLHHVILEIVDELRGLHASLLTAVRQVAEEAAAGVTEMTATASTFMTTEFLNSVRTAALKTEAQVELLGRKGWGLPGLRSNQPSSIHNNNNNTNASTVMLQTRTRSPPSYVYRNVEYSQSKQPNHNHNNNSSTPPPLLPFQSTTMSSSPTSISAKPNSKVHFQLPNSNNNKNNNNNNNNLVNTPTPNSQMQGGYSSEYSDRSVPHNDNNNNMMYHYNNNEGEETSYPSTIQTEHQKKVYRDMMHLISSAPCTPVVDRSNGEPQNYQNHLQLYSNYAMTNTANTDELHYTPAELLVLEAVSQQLRNLVQLLENDGQQRREQEERLTAVLQTWQSSLVTEVQAVFSRVQTFIAQEAVSEEAILLLKQQQQQHNSNTTNTTNHSGYTNVMNKGIKPMGDIPSPFAAGFVGNQNKEKLSFKRRDEEDNETSSNNNDNSYNDTDNIENNRSDASDSYNKNTFSLKTGGSIQSNPLLTSKSSIFNNPLTTRNNTNYNNNNTNIHNVVPLSPARPKLFDVLGTPQTQHKNIRDAEYTTNSNHINHPHTNNNNNNLAQDIAFSNEKYSNRHIPRQTSPSIRSVSRHSSPGAFPVSVPSDTLSHNGRSTTAPSINHNNHINRTSPTTRRSGELLESGNDTRRLPSPALLRTYYEHQVALNINERQTPNAANANVMRKSDSNSPKNNDISNNNHATNKIKVAPLISFPQDVMEVERDAANADTNVHVITKVHNTDNDINLGDHTNTIAANKLNSVSPSNRALSSSPSTAIKFRQNPSSSS